MTKKELGKQIEALRKECGVSTYDLEKKGIHPSLPSTIEKGKKGYTIDSLLNYLNIIMTEKEQQLNYDISQLIIFNQLTLEANERLKKYPSLYRQYLKKLSNDLHKELEKHIPIYDETYFEAEDFMLITQQQLEFLIPMLRSLRLDELATLPHLIEAYKKDREKTEQFLHEILNKKLK